MRGVPPGPARSPPSRGPGTSQTFPDTLVELARQLAGGEGLGDGVQVVELLPVRALRSSLRLRRRLRLLLPRHGRAPSPLPLPGHARPTRGNYPPPGLCQPIGNPLWRYPPTAPANGERRLPAPSPRPPGLLPRLPCSPRPRGSLPATLRLGPGCQTRGDKLSTRAFTGVRPAVASPAGGGRSTAGPCRPRGLRRHRGGRRSSQPEARPSDAADVHERQGTAELSCSALGEQPANFTGLDPDSSQLVTKMVFSPPPFFFSSQGTFSHCRAMLLLFLGEERRFPFWCPS